MSGWQPIETAPKDGTRFLIVKADEPGSEEICEWCVQRYFNYVHVEGDLYRKVEQEPLGFWNGNGHRATHWQPLPPPPAPNETEGEGNE